MDRHAGDIGQKGAVELKDVFVMRDVVVGDGHLAAADAGADVGQAVVVADGFVLVVGVGLAGLGGVPQDGLLRGGIGTDEGAAAGGGDHLVAVEGEHAELAEGAQDLTVKAGAEALGSILDDGDPVPVGNLQDPVDLIRHPIQGDGDDGLRHPAGLRNPILDRLFQQVRVHIPGLLFTVDENRRRAQVRHRMRRRAEGEALHQHLIAGSNPAGQQPQVHRRRPGRQRHDLTLHVMPDLIGHPFHELLQILLEPVHVGSQGHNPVGIKGFLDESLLLAAHMGQAEIDSFCHICQS